MLGLHLRMTTNCYNCFKNVREHPMENLCFHNQTFFLNYQFKVLWVKGKGGGGHHLKNGVVVKKSFWRYLNEIYRFTMEKIPTIFLMKKIQKIITFFHFFMKFKKLISYEVYHILSRTSQRVHRKKPTGMLLSRFATWRHKSWDRASRRI
jgi:hypothetical protein